MKEFASMLHSLFSAESNLYNKITIIPCITSKRQDSLLFNDRLFKTMEELQKLDRCYHIENCLDIKEDTKTSSNEGATRHPNKIFENIIIKQPDKPLKEFVFLIDDVLTTGGHFKACQRAISENFGININNIYGIFLAKTDHKYDDEIPNPFTP